MKLARVAGGEQSVLERIVKSTPQAFADRRMDLGVNPALPLSTSVIWGKLVCLSKPFSNLQNGDNNTSVAGLEEGVKVTGGKYLAPNK